MSASSERGLKHPFLVYAVSTLYILSPFINFLLTLWVYEVPHFWSPSTWLEWIPRIKLLSWAFVGVMSASGVALILKKRWSWIWSVAMLILTITLNIILSFQSGDVAPLNHEWTFFSIGSIVLILTFFRFPYLDRREQWFKVALRHKANIPLYIRETKKEGILKNISLTGALVETTPPLPPLGFLVELQIGKKGLFPSKIVRTQKPNHIGVQFCYLDKKNQGFLRRILDYLQKQGEFVSPVENQEMKRALPFLYD